MIELTNADIGRINPRLLCEELCTALGFQVTLDARLIDGLLDRAYIAKPDGGEFSAADRDRIYSAVGAHDPDALSAGQHDAKDALANIAWARAYLSTLDANSLAEFDRAMYYLVMGGGYGY